MESVVLISGSSHYSFAKLISDELKISLTECELGKFPNGERRCKIKSNVRGKKVFIIQTGISSDFDSVNDYLMETLIIADACRRSSAKYITLVCPLYFYARQDKKDKARAPITAALTANLIEASGVNRVVTMDLHAEQIQGMFKIPVDNLYAKSKVISLDIFNKSNCVAVSPDAGATKRTISYSKDLKLQTFIMHKERDYSKVSKVDNVILIGNSNDIKNKTAFIFDDLIDTCGTIIKVAEKLKEYNVTEIIPVITHGVFSDPAYSNLAKNNSIKEIWVSNSCVIKPLLNPPIKVFDVSELFAKAIKCISTGDSISDLFNN